MSKFTEKEAMEYIFKSKTLTAIERVFKSRYNQNAISKKAIDEFLLTNGFEIAQEKLYTKS